ncbi:hypothetical protein BaRGS_00034989 [Batillaria attramentaria]|uniref:Uncharacterized protein n=1 Tax=Batillaria attramentaria TaxID=370345 RepID=A0ABD0JG10_9CAEN
MFTVTWVCVALATFLTLTHGLVPTKTPYETGTGSKPLCVPKEWFGGQAVTTGTVVNGQATVTNGMTLVMYSAVLKMIRETPYFQNRALLYDYPAGKLYTIMYNSTSETCKVSPLTSPFMEWCVPGEYNITVDPNTNFGAGSQVTGGMEVRSIVGDLTYHVTMTVQNLPMFEEVYGTKDGGEKLLMVNPVMRIAPFFQNVLFYNMSVAHYVPNAFPFKVPDSCKHGQAE